MIHLLWKGFNYSLQFEAGHPWDGYAPGLRPGWLFGRRIDLSDNQWREFRGALPALLMAFLAFATTSRLLRKFVCKAHIKGVRIAFYLIFSFGYLYYLHGPSSLWVVLLVSANWWLTTSVRGSQAGMAVVWLLNIVTLVFIRLTDGFSTLHGLTSSTSLFHAVVRALLRPNGYPMRWYICFNLTMLRMLSFSMDYHWYTIHKTNSQDNLDVNSHGAQRRWRRTRPLPSEEEYCLVNALAYALYPPLYLAGPIITFNDFTWQLSLPETSSENASSMRKQLWQCAWRLGADIFCMELLTHVLYFNSLAIHRIGTQYKQYGLRFGAGEVGMTGWWVLSFMWLKFAIIWRSFRLAALAEGIDPPENMVCCFANNYDIEGFWKGWHASYNLWLVRYIYIPLGGASRRAIAIWPIFLFVALWHDLEWKMVSWAWLICFAFLPELLVKKWSASSRFDSLRNTKVFQNASAAAAALNISLLMVVNMVGFVVGPDGIVDLLKELVESPLYIAASLFCFYCGAHIAFVCRPGRTAVGGKEG